MLKLSEGTEDKVQSFLNAGVALAWTMVLWNICTLLGYGLAVWLIVKLFVQLQMFIH